MSCADRTDRGFALTEVLVAAAIAAAVLGAAMTGISASVRAARSADIAVIEARTAANIVARLEAGLSPALAVEGYPGWQVRLEATSEPVDPRTGAALSVAYVTSPAGGERQGWDLVFILVEEGTP